MAHVNINYRYQSAELIPLCDNLDIRVMFYDAEFAERVADLQKTLPGMVAFVEVCAEKNAAPISVPATVAASRP